MLRATGPLGAFKKKIALSFYHCAGVTYNFKTIAFLG